MVKYSAQTSPPELDAVFAALADPTRRRMLDRLSRGPATVGELAEPFSISLPGVSKHLRVLERAGLLRRHKRGRQQHCQLMEAPMRDASRWLEQMRGFWERQFDALETYLESETSKEDKTCPKSKRKRKPPSSSSASSRRRRRRSSKPSRGPKP